MKRILAVSPPTWPSSCWLGIILRYRLRGHLDAQGVDLNLGALLVFAAVVGFTGAFISLAMSKWDRQAHVGVRGHHPAGQPGREAGWFNTVRQQAHWPHRACRKVGRVRFPGAERVRHGAPVTRRWSR